MPPPPPPPPPRHKLRTLSTQHGMWIEGTIIEWRPPLTCQGSSKFIVRYGDNGEEDEISLPDARVHMLSVGEEGSALSHAEQRQTFLAAAQFAEREAQSIVKAQGWHLHVSNKTDSGFQCVHTLPLKGLGVLAYVVKTAIGGQVLVLGCYPSKTQAALFFARWLHAQEAIIVSEPALTSFGNMVIPATMLESMEAGAVNTIEKVLDIRHVKVELTPKAASAERAEYTTTSVVRRTKTTVATRAAATAASLLRSKLSVALKVATGGNSNGTPAVKAALTSAQMELKRDSMAAAANVGDETVGALAPLATSTHSQVYTNRCEYLVKKRGYSYFRSTWLTAEQIQVDGCLSERALQRFVRKLEDEPVDRSYKRFLVAERAIAQRSVSGCNEYLVKWNGLCYNDCSWERAADLPQVLVLSYLKARDHGSVAEAQEGVKGSDGADSEAEREARLPLRLSAWASKGMEVEAATAAKGLRGAWLRAMADRLFAKSMQVEYSELYSEEPGHETERVIERCCVERVQPLPPCTPKDWRPKVGQVVQFAHGIGWWVAVVKCMRRRGEELVDDDAALPLQALAAIAELAPGEEYAEHLNGQPLQSAASLSVGTTMLGVDGHSWEVRFAMEGAATTAASMDVVRAGRASRQLGGPEGTPQMWTPLLADCEEPVERDRTRRATSRKEDAIHPRLKSRLHAKVPGSRVVVMYTENKGDSNDPLAEQPFRAAYRGVVVQYTPGKELLVRFDGYPDGDDAAECFVDEAGEDEWCWEEEYDASADRPVVATFASNLAERTMWLVMSPQENMHLWKSSCELRPNWEWRGSEEGFIERATLVRPAHRQNATCEDGGAKQAMAEEQRTDEVKEVSMAGLRCDVDNVALNVDNVALNARAAVSTPFAATEEVADGDKYSAGCRQEVVPLLAASCAAEVSEDEEKMVKLTGWSKLKESPTFCNGRVLRPYQLEGLNWLRRNYFLGRNVILGDETGLGKSAQALAMLQTLRTIDRVIGPFLVIVPLCALGHWEHEIRAWTDMYRTTYHGSANSRKVLLKYDWHDSPPSKREVRYRFHVLLSTYETLLQEPGPVMQVRWQYLIVDEGHRLQHRNSRVLEVMHKLRARCKLVLTSMPLQNHVSVLWSILNFLYPAKFDDLDAFLGRLGAASSGARTAEQVNMLSHVLQPHLLRREKDDVEALCYPMCESVLFVEITNLQKLCYRAVLEHNRDLLLCDVGAAGVVGTASVNLSNVLMTLRQCCNHPWVIELMEESATTWLEEESSMRKPLSLRECSDPSYWRTLRRAHEAEDSERYIERLVKSSGKLLLLDKLLPRLNVERHRVLLFSQCNKMLELCSDLVKYRQWPCERLDCGIQSKERQGAVDRFNDPDSKSFILMISARTSGVAMSFTAADTVILVDPDGKPQIDIQAVAHCHRFGQTKPIQVYRLCTKDTYEMQMLSKALLRTGGNLERKMTAAGLARMERCNQIAMFSQNSHVERLHRSGAQILLSIEQDRKAAEFGKKSIDHILARYAVELAPGETYDREALQCILFSQAPFTCKDDGILIEIDDPTFWAKVLTEEFEPASAAHHGFGGIHDVVKLWRPLRKRQDMRDLKCALQLGRRLKDDEGHGIKAQRGLRRQSRVKEPAWTVGELQILMRALLAYGHHRAHEQFAAMISAGREDADAYGEQLHTERDMRSIKKVADYMLTCWILRSQPTLQREWTPLRLHTRPEMQVLEMASAADALVSANEKELIRAVGGIMRPRGRPPSNDNGEPLVWSYIRGRWVDAQIGGVFKGQLADPDESMRLEAERTELEVKIRNLREGEHISSSEPSTPLLRGLKVLELRLRPKCEADANAWILKGEGQMEARVQDASLESLEREGLCVAPSACLERLIGLRAIA